MPSITEGGLTFRFPDEWGATKLDEWTFYRRRFQQLGNEVRVACTKCSAELRCRSCGTSKTGGVKSVDVLAINRSYSVWFIEIKDYRGRARTKAIDLADEVALKVRDSLALLVAARTNASGEERDFAISALKCAQIRVVLHLEQGPTRSSLRPVAISPANVLQRLRQLVRAVDSAPLVLARDRLEGVKWSVT